MDLVHTYTVVTQRLLLTGVQMKDGKVAQMLASPVSFKQFDIVDNKFSTTGTIGLSSKVV